MSGEADTVRVLGSVACYEDLHQLMRARADELEITRDALDKLARLPERFSAKLLAPKPMRKLSDETLGFVMPALGMKLIAIEDLEAIEMMRARSERRKSVTVLGSTLEITFSRRELKRRQKRGGKNRQAQMTAKQRSAHARHMNRIRWSEVKKAAREAKIHEVGR